MSKDKDVKFYKTNQLLNKSQSVYWSLILFYSF